MKIIVTGGAGFIGSCCLRKLNREGVNDILVVDSLGKDDKWRNLNGKEFQDYIEKETFLSLVREDKLDKKTDAVIHLGACSDTTETDAGYLAENNYAYSRELARWALQNKVLFLYASSAATYGDGRLGYNDADETSLKLRPLNMYGFSKHLFDLWLIRNGLSDKVTGFKFFNVFGPNEYHKGDMRSMVYKGLEQVKQEGEISLFQSYRPDYKDGEQKRDFIYVKDAVNIIYYFLTHPGKKGIYNVGSGKARSWNDLAHAIFSALAKTPRIRYIDMPARLQGQYQYFTEAEIEKLRKAGYQDPFFELEEAVKDYIGILEKDRYW